MPTRSAPPTPAKPSNQSAPAILTWLQPLGLTRDPATWTYRLSNGHQFPVSVTSLISAVTKTPEQMEAIMTSRHIWEPRGNTIHKALEVMAHQRFNPNPPPNLSPAPHGDYGAWIEPLLSDELWDSISVIGAEVMAYSMRRNVAGTADLVIRFPDGTYGIADLKTQSSERSTPYDTRPQLGAGVEMIGDHYKLLFSRCLTLWSRPGSLVIQTHTADECLQAWLDVCEEYAARFRPF